MQEIRNVSWAEIEESIRQYLITWEVPNIIIAVSRGGVPIAVALSYASGGVPISYITRRDFSRNYKPFYIFDGNSVAREVRYEKEFVAPKELEDYKSALIVDDVATFGGTLDVTTRLVRRDNPDIDLSYFCYAVDRERLFSRKPGIFDKLYAHTEIDNSQVWLQMPWQIT